MKIWERAADFDAAKGSRLRLDGDHRPQPRARHRAPLPAGVAGGHAGGVRAGGREPWTRSPDGPRSEVYAALMRCLTRLKADKREMVLLAYYRGASREALAARYKAPVGTVKTWLGAVSPSSGIVCRHELSPDDEGLAAEYALGTLDAAERADVAARRLREPELDAAISAWEARLAPLRRRAPERPPPAGLFERIRRASAGAGRSVGVLRARLARWRAAARRGAGALAAALAAALAFLVVDARRPRRISSSPSCKRARTSRPSR